GPSAAPGRRAPRARKDVFLRRNPLVRSLVASAGRRRGGAVRRRRRAGDRDRAAASGGGVFRRPVALRRPGALRFLARSGGGGRGEVPQRLVELIADLDRP